MVMRDEGFVGLPGCSPCTVPVRLRAFRSAAPDIDYPVVSFKLRLVVAAC
jgi:hypothetical protein